jgi:hypothetical protein
MNYPKFTTQEAKDGYWQWCAKPPRGDHVHGGFESEYAACADALRWIEGQVVPIESELDENIATQAVDR